MAKKLAEQLSDDETIIEGTYDVEEESTETEETEEELIETSTETEETEEEPTADKESDELVVTIGDEEPPSSELPEKAPEWVKDLRKTHRETQRENRALKERLKTLETPQQPKIEVGEKPRLADHDYDEEKYAAALADWHRRQQTAKAEQEERERKTKADADAWKARLEGYETAKKTLKVKDFDDAESVILEKLSDVQQGIVIHGAENAALIFYALGKNEKRVNELAAITDPVKFAFAVAKLEKDLKVTTKKAPPPPEKTVTGTGSKSGTVDSTLERLRAEAEKTGDYTKVTAYKRKKRHPKS